MLISKFWRSMVLLLTLASTLLLGGCPSKLGGDVYSRDEARRTMTVQFATVESVRFVQIEGTKSNVGTIAGGAIGGAAGSGIGHGGRASAVGAVVGAVVGGIAGAAIEEGATRTRGVEVTVRMDNGQYQAIVQEDGGEMFSPGERVRILRNGGTARVSR